MSTNFSRIALSATAFAAALTLAACGGGGGSTSTIPAATNAAPTTNAPAAPARATASMTITIPASRTTDAVRSTRYISSQTKSMTFALVGSTAAAQEFDLTATSPGCSKSAAGDLVCTVSVGAPVGNDTFAVVAYDAIGGTGNKLSTATVASVITAGGTNAVPLVMNGVVATATVVLGTGTSPVGTAGSTLVALQAKDAAGATIVGPGNFDSPVTLAITGDPHSTLALSTSSFTSPGQSATLAYSGGSLVGARITPSGTNVTGVPATFSATGLKVNIFTAEIPYAYGTSTPPNTSANSLRPYDVAAFSNGTAAVMFYTGSFYDGTHSVSVNDVIGLVTPTALGKIFYGTTSDPYAPVTTAPTLTLPNVAFVPNMSQSMITEGYNGYTSLAPIGTGKVAYLSSYSSTAATDRCPSGTREESGIVGVLDTTSGTTVETKLSGYPYQIRSDSNNNLWFTEYAGDCRNTSTGATTSLFKPGGVPTFDYIIGELSSAGVLTENAVSSYGLTFTQNDDLSDMAITTDGTTMYIARNSASKIAKIPLAGGTASAVNLTLSQRPISIAVADDGTVAWAGSNVPNNNYYWGEIPGSKTFTTANIVETQFTSQYFQTYSLSYADGSFFGASDYSSNSVAFLGRLANVGSATLPLLQSNTPVIGGNGNTPYFSGSSVGGGYFWAMDNSYGNIVSVQYGAPGSGQVSGQSLNRRPSVSGRHVLAAKPARHIVHPAGPGLPLVW